MNVVLSVLICFFSYALIQVYSVPPDICYEEFKWQDCGMHPKPVIYYYKSGSRCEVGMWRGCLPNNNMFEDEYDCVQTCIFSLREQPVDYHELLQAKNLIEYDETMTKTNLGTTTKASNVTSTGDSGGGGVIEDDGANTPAETAADEDNTAADGEGDTPADIGDVASDGGEVPADNADAPAEGVVTPATDGELPAEETSPTE